MQEQLNLHPWVWWLIIIVTLIMIERLIQRMIAVKRVYKSWLPALLSIPRAFYGNLLNLHAVLRAYHVYYTTPKSQATSKQPVWDKTEHHFPGSHILMPYRHKLGYLLLKKNLITESQLSEAVLEQQKTGERLGKILCKLNLISNHELSELLSEQYGLELFPQSKLRAIKNSYYLDIPPQLSHWFLKHDVQIIAANNGKRSINPIYSIKK